MRGSSGRLAPGVKPLKRPARRTSGDRSTLSGIVVCASCGFEVNSRPAHAPWCIKELRRQCPAPCKDDEFCNCRAAYAFMLGMEHASKSSTPLLDKLLKKGNK